jgi:UDP-2,3-diacylglucosamine hydrolase
MIRTPPEVVSLAAPVYFLSDAHLGAPPEEIASVQRERLEKLFNEVVMKRGSLVIAGDLFDFWYEWRHVIPKQHFPVLFQLKRLIDQHIPVFYLAGNHDFKLHGFLDAVIGVRTLRDDLAVKVGDQSVYVFHGDGVLARDHGYRFLKKVLRNPAAQRAFSWIHPDWGMTLARGTSKTSRAHERGGVEDDKDYLAFAQQKFAEGYTGVVMGHTHRPVEHHEGPHTYLNLGDWITHFTYGLHDGARLSLRHWGDSGSSQATVGE